jgi:hypothetical protein
MIENGIDFILPWVDGDDVEWQREKSKYVNSEGISNKNNSQYRDWGIMPFWFRSVERYAPWVRKIHFVTCGHYPEWLNLRHPKLNFVKHEDFIPHQYLPTFSSHPIELNMHRIPGLSDNFVYFNDDVFIISPVKPSDFFKKGLPRDCAIRNLPMLYDIGHINLNAINLINKEFRFDKQFKEHLWKWLNYRYGIRCLQSLFFAPLVEFTGAKNMHITNAYLKSTLIDVWEKEGSVLDQTCHRRFRSVLDVNQWIFKYWQIVSGSFYPQWLSFGRAISIYNSNILKKYLTSHKYKVICLQDSDWVSDISALKQEVQKVLFDAFPEKSSFEL